MKYKIFLLFVGILLISFISASSIYAGDCLEVDLSELESLDNVVYDVVGNESNLEGLTIDLNETTKNVSICTVPNYKPDSFTIIFIDNSTKTIVKEVPVPSGCSGCGGGTRTVYVENKTIEYVDKVIYKDKEIEVEVIKEIEVIENSSRNTLVIIMGIIIIISLIIGGYFLKRKLAKNE